MGKPRKQQMGILADPKTNVPVLMTAVGRQSSSQASRYRCMMLVDDPKRADKQVLLADIRLEQN